MGNEASKPPLSRMNRRQMLGTTTALVAGVVAVGTREVLGQEKSKAPLPGAP